MMSMMTTTSITTAFPHSLAKSLLLLLVHLKGNVLKINVAVCIQSFYSLLDVPNAGRGLSR